MEKWVKEWREWVSGILDKGICEGIGWRGEWKFGQRDMWRDG